MTKCSVIIPIYNVEDYLCECIDSVLAQNASVDFEVILVDDGSPDGSGAICDRYAQEHSNIRVVHDTNHGVSHARNVGLNLAQGEYILFLDADDLWEPNLLETAAPLLEDKPDMILYGHNRLYEDGTKAHCALRLCPMGESGEKYLHRLFERNMVPHFYPWCCLYRRAFLNDWKIRFQEDLKVSEDFDFNMRAFAVANRVLGVDEPLYGYRIRGGSVTATLSEKKLMDNLTTKAAYFRTYPVAAMANLYAQNAILVAEFPKTAAGTAEKFLKENRDIWNHVSDAPYKLGRMLVKFFGDRNGARVYYAIRSIACKLRHRS